MGFLKKRLLISKNIPAFSEEYDENQDPFGHKTIAEALKEIIDDNEGPLTIGLFGPWGCGKSSVLNILKNKLIKSSKAYKVVYFNAWKYANDSFRRQFVLECIEQLITDEEKKKNEKKLFKERWLRDVEREIASWKELFKNMKVKPNISIILEVVILFVIVFGLLGCGIVTHNIVLKITSLGFMSIVMPLVIYAVQRFTQIFQISIPVEVDPKLILPEQFEDEFLRIISSDELKDNHIVFMIDDLDRCPPSMIMDVLDTMKTFLAPSLNLSMSQESDNFYSKCYYIIALDDKAVTRILQRNRGRNYMTEEVLKFFDTVVRISPLQRGDLIEFAKKISKKYDVPEEVIYIAMYGGFNTPRKIKHFLNTLKIAFNVVNKRFKEKLFPYNPRDIISQLTKILVLQEKYHDFFEKLVGDPQLLNKAEKIAEQKYGTQAEYTLKSAPNNQEFSDDLLLFLWATHNIEITGLEAFMYLKYPEWALGMKNFTQIRQAIEKADITSLKKVIHSQDEFSKENLYMMFSYLLDQEPSGIMLENILFSGLFLYSTFFSSADEILKRNFADLLMRYLYKVKNLFRFDIDTVFMCVDILPGRHLENERRIVLLGVKSMGPFSDPIKVSEFISILFKRGIIENYGKVINERILEIAKKDIAKVISILKNIQLPSEFDFEKAQVRVPDIGILEYLITFLERDKTKIQLFKNINSVLFKFWLTELREPLSKKYYEILQKLLVSEKIIEVKGILKLVLDAIEEMPEWIDEKVAPNIMNNLWGLFGKVQNSTEKFKILKIYLISAYSCDENSPQRQQGINYTIANIHIFSVKELREIIEFIRKYKKKGNWWEQLEEKLFDKAIDRIIQEPNNKENLQKMKYILEQEDWLDYSAKIEAVVKKILLKLNDHRVIQDWSEIFLILAEKSQQFKGKIIGWCKHFADYQVNFSYETRKALLNVLLNLAQKCDLKSRKQLGKWVIDIAFENNRIPRMVMEEMHRIKALMGNTFKRTINDKLKVYCKLGFNKIVNKKDFALLCINYVSIWNKSTSKEFTDLLHTLMASANSQNINVAYAFIKEIVTIMPEVLDSKRNELVKDIENWVIYHPIEKAKWEPLLNALKERSRKNENK